MYDRRFRLGMRQVWLLGLDPREDRDQVREGVGVRLQEARLPHRLKVWEVDLYSSFYETPVS
jgi:ABC-2 type transport system ATP-binding protein